MMNEEIKSAMDAISSMEEAYQLAVNNGYEGDRESFDALCAQAAKATSREK